MSALCLVLTIDLEVESVGGEVFVRRGARLRTRRVAERLVATNDTHFLRHSTRTQCYRYKYSARPVSFREIDWPIIASILSSLLYLWLSWWSRCDGLLTAHQA